MEYDLSEHAATTVRERDIRPAWIDITLTSPELIKPHPEDPALRYAFRRIPEHGDRVLRVIYNADTNPVTIVTAYFDRTMKDKL
jgi:hypothetical protein